MRRPRKPRWHELNKIVAAGIKHPEHWQVERKDKETMTIWNRKTGAVREIPMGGKIKQELQPGQDPEEALARELRERRNHAERKADPCMGPEAKAVNL